MTATTSNHTRYLLTINGKGIAGDHAVLDPRMAAYACIGLLMLQSQQRVGYSMHIEDGAYHVAVDGYEPIRFVKRER